MIDIHSHILPYIDDGAKSFDEAVAMARLAVADGVKVMVATPHLNESIYSPAKISGRVEHLTYLLRKKNIPLTIMIGADVNVVFRAEQVGDFTINGTKYILIEFPHSRLLKNASDIVQSYVQTGLKPIITHPERNPSITANPDLLFDLLGDNIYVQVTSGSLTGEFGRKVQACANHLLRAGEVELLASDAHSSTWRQPGLSKGMKAAAEIVGEAAAHKMVSSNPFKIISGNPL